MLFVRVSECFFLVEFEPILRGRDRKDPSRIVLQIQEVLRLVIGHRVLTGAG